MKYTVGIQTERATIEDIDIERIKSETGINNIEIINHTVIRKPQWEKTDASVFLFLILIFI